MTNVPIFHSPTQIILSSMMMLPSLLLLTLWLIQSITSVDCSFLHTTLTSKEHPSRNSSGDLCNFHPTNFTYIHREPPEEFPLDLTTYVYQIIRNDNGSGEERVIYSSQSKIHFHTSSQDTKLLALCEDCYFGCRTRLSILNLENGSILALRSCWIFRPQSLAFSPDSTHLLVHDAQSVSIWNSITGQRLIVVSPSPTLSAIGNGFFAYYKDNRLNMASFKPPHYEALMTIPEVSRIFITEHFIVICQDSMVDVREFPYMECKLSVYISADLLVSSATARDDKLFFTTSDATFAVYSLKSKRRLFSVRLSFSTHSASFDSNRLSIRVSNNSSQPYKTLTYHYKQICTTEICLEDIPLPLVIKEIIANYAKRGFSQRVYRIPMNVAEVYINNHSVVFSIKGKQDTVTFSSHSISTGRRHELLENVPLNGFSKSHVVKVGNSVVGRSKSGDLVTRPLNGDRDSTILKGFKYFSILASRLAACKDNTLTLCTLKGKRLWTRTVDGHIGKLVLDSCGVSIETPTRAIRYDLLGNVLPFSTFVTMNLAHQATFEGHTVKLYDPTWKRVMETFDVGLGEIRGALFIDDKLIIITKTVWSVVEL